MTGDAFLARKWSGLRTRVHRYRRRLLHRPKHFLAIYAIMQNEAHILREWIDIHLREGFEHFFLLDHGSTDDWRSRIADRIAQGVVTVRTLSNPEGSLDKLRVEHADFALDGAEWLIMQDLDEFTYATGRRDIAGFLRNVPAGVHQIVVPWVVFGTGGNVEQPDYIVRDCIRSEDMAARPALNDAERAWHAKSLFRPRYMTTMRTHIHDVEGETVAPLDDHVPITGNFYITNRLAERLGEFCILQNHYIHQSLAFYRKKMERKGYWLETNRGEKSYTMERFEREERILNAVENTALLDKHREYYACLTETRERTHSESPSGKKLSRLNRL